MEEIELNQEQTQQLTNSIETLLKNKYGNNIEIEKSYSKFDKDLYLLDTTIYIKNKRFVIQGFYIIGFSLLIKIKDFGLFGIRQLLELIEDTFYLED